MYRKKVGRVLQNRETVAPRPRRVKPSPPAEQQVVGVGFSRRVRDSAGFPRLCLDQVQFNTWVCPLDYRHDFPLILIPADELGISIRIGFDGLPREDFVFAWEDSL